MSLGRTTDPLPFKQIELDSTALLVQKPVSAGMCEPMNIAGDPSRPTKQLEALKISKQHLGVFNLNIKPSTKNGSHSNSRGSENMAGQAKVPLGRHNH